MRVRFAAEISVALGIVRPGDRLGRRWHYRHGEQTHFALGQRLAALALLSGCRHRQARAARATPNQTAGTGPGTSGGTKRHGRRTRSSGTLNIDVMRARHQRRARRGQRVRHAAGGRIARRQPVDIIVTSTTPAACRTRSTRREQPQHQFRQHFAARGSIPRHLGVLHEKKAANFDLRDRSAQRQHGLPPRRICRLHERFYQTA